MEAAFRAAGANPGIGSGLAVILREAGVSDVQTFGIQGYIAAGDPTGPALLSGVVRSLHGAIVAPGIATADEIGIETLEERLGRDLEAANAVLLPPTVVGAWGRA